MAVYVATSIRVYFHDNLPFIIDYKDPNTGWPHSRSESMSNVFDLPFQSTWNSAQTNMKYLYIRLKMARFFYVQKNLL